MSLAARLREALERGHRRQPELIAGDVLDERGRSARASRPRPCSSPVVDRPEPT